MSDPWHIERAYERAADSIGEQYERGELSDNEYNDAMRELDRDARDEYEQARQEAIEEVAEQWGW